jgi:TolB-like protein/Flp pilus assembly protein TadD
MSFFAELKRRNVYKIAAAYIVGSWLLLQVADVLFPAFDMPIGSIRLLAVTLLFSFPLALILAWAFQITPDGIKRSSATGPVTGKSLNLKFTLALLGSGLVIIAVLLAIPTSRSWLTETAVSVAMKTASIISPFELEKELGIAVLPFVNMSSDAENEYFSDGISEEILNALVKTSRMPVIARTSSFQFKGQNQDIKKIGSLLGVTHILEGSVRKSGNKVRVTAQLIDTSTGAHLWSETYDRELADIFIVQDEIAGMIVEQIGNTLEGEERERFYVEVPGGELQSRGTTNREAHESVLRGLQLRAVDDPRKVEESLAYFERATEQDPNYVDAWALKGSTLLQLGGPQTGSRIPAEVHPEAIAAFRTALELEPNHAFSMGWLGYVLMVHEFRWLEGMQLMERSLELSPNDPGLLSVYGWYLLNMRQENAGNILDRAYRANPLDPLVLFIRLGKLAQEGRMLDALGLVDAGLINNREGYSANYLAAMFNMAVGRVDAAEKHLRVAQRMVGEDYPSLKLIESAISALRGQLNGNLELAELLALAETGQISFLLIAPWSPELLPRAWDIVLRQRHAQILMSIFGPKPYGLSEAKWAEIQTLTNTAEVTLGTATLLLRRSAAEREELLARAIELSPERLDLFAGIYDEGTGPHEITRFDGHLRNEFGRVLIAVGPSRFAALDQKAEIEFILEDGVVTGYVGRVGQREIRAVRIEPPSSVTP